MCKIRTYQFKVSFKLATNVDGGMIGVGGSPGESVYVKCGITPIEPKAVVYVTDDYFRLNIDKGSQSQSGNDMMVVGNMVKNETLLPGAYEFKTFHAEFTVTADHSGKVYLVIGTDSGFEATISYYLDDISIKWSKVAEQPTVTRGRWLRCYSTPLTGPAQIQDIAHSKMLIKTIRILRQLLGPRKMDTLSDMEQECLDRRTA